MFFSRKEKELIAPLAPVAEQKEKAKPVETSAAVFPLHEAVKQENIPLVEQLLHQGYSVVEQDALSKTAIDYARQYGFQVMTALLESKITESQNVASRLPFPISKLVIEGGGPTGTPILGVLQVLQEMDVLSHLTEVAGTSAGAIAAAFLGMGYSLTELQTVLLETDFGSFQDSPLFNLPADQFTKKLISIKQAAAKGTSVGSSSAALEMFSLWQMNKPLLREIVADVQKNYGLCKGDVFFEWIANSIKKKGFKESLTFEEHHHYVQTQLLPPGQAAKLRDIYLVGVNLNTSAVEVYSWRTTPHMELRTAVRISMSIPIAFAAMREGMSVKVDGGVLWNYPIQIFDENDELNPEVLGIRFDSHEEIDQFREAKLQSHEIQDVNDLLGQLSKTLLSAQQKPSEHRRNRFRTIYCDFLDVKLSDFAMSMKKKMELVHSGRQATRQYFQQLVGLPLSDPFFAGIAAKQAADHLRLKHVMGRHALGRLHAIAIDHENKRVQIQLSEKQAARALQKYLAEIYGIENIQHTFIEEGEVVIQFHASHPHWFKLINQWMHKHHASHIKPYPLVGMPEIKVDYVKDTDEEVEQKKPQKEQGIPLAFRY